MSWWEILIIIILVSFVSFIFGNRIYRMIKHKPVEKCGCTPNGNELKKWYYKTYKKDCHCTCGYQNKE